jgi:para-aminobenzoate synthetase/4-amino-4-deoxychorismate lyase
MNLVLPATVPAVLLRAPQGWWRGGGPGILRVAWRLEEVVPLLAAVEREAAGGGFCAGFVVYEAAPAFDGALAVATAAPGLSLAAFAMFERRERVRALPALARGGEATLEDLGAEAWRESRGEAEYKAGIASIKNAIAAGDVYQVNYTHRLRAPFGGEPWELFHRLVAGGAPPHAAYLDFGAFAICSASPELFFSLRHDRLVSRPMKGTAARGRSWQEDVDAGRRLLASPKERAENLMIVDMVRNDLGRVAKPGSVRTPDLFRLERYPTLWQLTSTVTARSRASLAEVFAALFPAASITGAPKASAMRQIADLEGEPRGVYTGAIGWVGPGRRATFGVAIRTATVHRQPGLAEYGTGGGVVWDSAAAAELAETRLKALVLAPPRRAFELLETLRWTPATGFFLLRAHLLRMSRSAEYFGYRWNEGAARAALAATAHTLAPAVHRVRLLCAPDGRFRTENEPLTQGTAAGGRRQRWRVALALRPVDAADRFLFHKTTCRVVFDDARASHPGCDDVLLWNRDGELTESTVANLVVALDGELVTPPLSSGLLPGTYRERLLARRRVVERVVRREDLARASGLWLVNSIRGWIPVELRG